MRQEGFGGRCRRKGKWFEAFRHHGTRSKGSASQRGGKNRLRGVPQYVSMTWAGGTHAVWDSLRISQDMFG